MHENEASKLTAQAELIELMCHCAELSGQRAERAAWAERAERSERAGGADQSEPRCGLG